MSYKSTIREFTHKIGGKIIDAAETTYYNDGRLPEWVITLAESYDKSPTEVMKELIKYRNSWQYQKHLSEQFSLKPTLSLQASISKRSNGEHKQPKKE